MRSFRLSFSEKNLTFVTGFSDVGYDLVFWHSLAEQIGVETPHISAVIRLASVLMGQDYLSQGKRTMKSLGLSGQSAGDLEQLLT